MKNSKLIIIIAVLITIVLVFLGYVIYEKGLDNPEEEVEGNSDALLNMYDIIENELYVLDGLFNINEITASEKARLARDLYCNGKIYGQSCTLNGNTVNTIYASDLEKSYNNSSLSNFKFSNASIACMPNLKNPNHYAWTYNDNNKTYNYTETGHGITVPIIAHKELIESDVKNNVFTISYKYLWARSNGDGLSDYNLYSTYEDAIDYNNSLSNIDYYPDTYLIDIKKVDEFYDNNPNLMMNLNTYTYNFKIENGKIKLIDFVRE